MKRLYSARLFALCAATMGLYPAFADVTLDDGNTRLVIDPESTQGMMTYEVDGQNHVNQQWYWYRMQGDTDESPLSAISSASVSQPAPHSAGIMYANNLISIEMSYRVHGGGQGSNYSYVTEIILIRNRTTQPRRMTFFQYSDLNLGGNGDDDRIIRTSPNSFEQHDNDVIYTESVSINSPNRWEVGLVPTTLNKFSDGLLTNLSSSGSPIGPTDGSFAWQWDFDLLPNGTFYISKERLMVPEPTSLLALGMGLTALLKRRRANKA
ncbi:MAG: PEP-CTERM sorting domain-containing protein [Fimbriimonadia bacterium]|nr:PEP-CTERM sorting domain-containing protein [Fimbriimonadia bacterium]